MHKTDRSKASENRTEPGELRTALNSLPARCDLPLMRQYSWENVSGYVLRLRLLDGARGLLYQSKPSIEVQDLTRSAANATPNPLPSARSAAGVRGGSESDGGGGFAPTQVSGRNACQLRLIHPAIARDDGQFTSIGVEHCRALNADHAVLPNNSAVSEDPRNSGARGHGWRQSAEE